LTPCDSHDIYWIRILASNPNLLFSRRLQELSIGSRRKSVIAKLTGDLEPRPTSMAPRQAVQGVLVVSNIVSVDQGECNSEEPHQEDGQPTYEQFVAATSFPYQAPEPRQQQLIQAYAGLSLDMPKAAVLRVLGPPDCSQSLYSKDPPRNYIGSEWTYYFAKPDSELVNEKTDRAIVIFFDRQDHADWIIPQNVSGLKEMKRQHGS
jgi:hypothetical protein